MTRRAPTTEVIPLGQTSTISRVPRQGWAMVTVTATCSSVFSPDWLRSAAETGGDTGANYKKKKKKRLRKKIQCLHF